jgi:hypothetical protein
MVYWLWDLAEVPPGGAGQIYFTAAVAGILLSCALFRFPNVPPERDGLLRSEIAIHSLAVLFMGVEAAWRWVGNWKLWMAVLLFAMLSARAGGVIARVDEEWNGERLTPRSAAWFLGAVVLLVQGVLAGWVWGEEIAAGGSAGGPGWMAKALLAFGAYTAAVSYAAYRVLRRDDRRSLPAGSLMAVLALNPLLPFVLRSRWGALAGAALVAAGAIAILSIGPDSRILRRETVAAFGIPWWLATGILFVPAAWIPAPRDLYIQHAWPLLASLAASVAAGTGAIVVPRFHRFLPIAMTGILLAACAPFLLSPRPSPGVFHPPRPGGNERVLLGEQVILSIRHPEHRLPVDGGPEPRFIRVSLSLANALSVDHGSKVGEISFMGEGWSVERVTLRAGIEAAEWAIDRRDVSRQVRHSRPPPGESWIVQSPNGESFVAHRYHVDILLAGRTSGEIRFRWNQPGGAKDMLLNIHKVLIREDPAGAEG